MQTTEAAEAYGPEWEALELIARGVATGADEDGSLDALLAEPRWDWGRMLHHLATHKLRGVAAERLLDERHRPHVPQRMRALLRELLALNRHRARVLGAHACRISGHAAREGIAAAARKGVVFDQELYGGRGTRVFSDLDFMVPPGDQAAFLALLEALGYVPGEYEPGADDIVPHDRRALLVYRMNPDHLPRMAAPTDDPLVPWVEVDVAGSLAWTRAEYDVPLEPAFAALHEVRPPGCDGALRTFPPEYQLLDAVLHLFREGFMESASRNGLPLTMSGLLDVALLWRRFGDGLSEGWGREVRRLGVEAPAAWVLGHADRVFGTAMLEGAGVADAFGEEWAGGWRAAGGAPMRWHGDMRRRLHGGGRIYDPKHPPGAA